MGDDMAVAGYCRVCGRNVWLNDQWGCVNGHAWNEISNWYDPEAGTRVTPYWIQAPEPEPAVAPAVPAPVPAAGPAPAPTVAPTATPTPVAPAASPAPQADLRMALLADIISAFESYPDYQVRYGTDTDIVIDNHIAAASWGVGHKKVDYTAVMKASEPERTLYYWELLKEQGAGMSFGGFESETYSTFGAARSGKKKQVVLGAGGVAIDYEWDYAATRGIVESVAARHGWKVKVVLRKKSAQW
jgi:hypothetical protein